MGRSFVGSLISKDGKDLSILGPFTSLSLLNTDYKILASILAACLLKICQRLIGPDQSDFLAGRYLSDSIQRIINLINFRKKVDKLIMALFTDAEKAFDCVEWDFEGLCWKN